MVDGLEKEETSEEAVEKDRSNSGQAERGGVRDIEGEGEESLVVVVVGDAVTVL